VLVLLVVTFLKFFLSCLYPFAEVRSDIAVMIIYEGSVSVDRIDECLKESNLVFLFELEKLESFHGFYFFNSFAFHEE